MGLALAAFIQLAEGMMHWEVDQVVGPKNQAIESRDKMRWGLQGGYCVIAGQKVPLQRPRVRDVRQREVPLGSYEMLQKTSLMEDSVWHKMMHGLTTRRYSEVVKELEQAYGIEKSTVSEYFIEASRDRLQKLQSRSLGEHAFCAMMIDGTDFRDQQVVVAIGLTLQGHKVVLAVTSRSHGERNGGPASAGGYRAARRGIRRSSAICSRWRKGLTRSCSEDGR